MKPGIDLNRIDGGNRIALVGDNLCLHGVTRCRDRGVGDIAVDKDLHDFIVTRARNEGFHCSENPEFAHLLSVGRQSHVETVRLITTNDIGCLNLDDRVRSIRRARVVAIGGGHKRVGVYSDLAFDHVLEHRDTSRRILYERGRLTFVDALRVCAHKCCITRNRVFRFGLRVAKNKIVCVNVYAVGVGLRDCNCANCVVGNGQVAAVKILIHHRAKFGFINRSRHEGIVRILQAHNTQATCNAIAFNIQRIACLGNACNRFDLVARDRQARVGNNHASVVPTWRRPDQSATNESARLRAFGLLHIRDQSLAINVNAVRIGFSTLIVEIERISGTNRIGFKGNFLIRDHLSGRSLDLVRGDINRGPINVNRINTNTSFEHCCCGNRNITELPGGNRHACSDISGPLTSLDRLCGISHRRRCHDRVIRNRDRGIIHIFKVSLHQALLRQRNRIESHRSLSGPHCDVSIRHQLKVHPGCVFCFVLRHARIYSIAIDSHTIRQDRFPGIDVCSRIRLDLVVRDHERGGIERQIA